MIEGEGVERVTEQPQPGGAGGDHVRAALLRTPQEQAEDETFLALY